MKRWFDLTGQNARLDRVIDDRGVAALVLTFQDKNRIDDIDNGEAVAKAGWIADPDDPNVLRNFAAFRDLTSIGKALSTIFKRDDVDMALIGRERLRQGERLDGVNRPVYVEMGSIENRFGNAPAEIQAVAREKILAARERVKSQSYNRIGTTNGRMLSISEQLAGRIGRPQAEAFAVVLSLRNEESELDHLQRLIASGSDEKLLQYVGAAEIGQRALEVISERIDLLHTDHPKRDEMVIWGLVEHHGVGDAVILDMDAPFRDQSLDVSMGFKTDVHGYKFEVSPDTTTLAAREYQARLEMAVSFIGETFGLDPEDVFGPNTRFRVVRHIKPGVNGYQESQHHVVDHDEDIVDEADAIVFHSGAIGVALHEMAHAFDRRLGDDPQKYDMILNESGLRERVQGHLASIQLHRIMEITPDRLTYYLSEHEMFARLFENAIREVSLERTGDIRAMGGTAVSGWRHSFAPYGPEVARDFIDAVREFGISQGIFPEPENDKTNRPVVEPPTAVRDRVSIGF